MAQDTALEPRWYAVRTRSRHEKRVHAQLAARPGIDVFLPLRERRSRWTDRVKRVQEPLFPGYCFARFCRPDRLRVLKAAGRGPGGLVGYADGPLIGPPGDTDGEAPRGERGDDQPAAGVGGIRLGMARRAERHQTVEVEVRAPLGALDDVMDLEGAPAAGRSAPPAGAPQHRWLDPSAA